MRVYTYMEHPLLETATTNVTDMVTKALLHTNEHNALIIFDTQSELATILTQAYKTALPNAQFIDFDTTPNEDILEIFDTMQPSDLVVLVQSSSFRLNQYRIRLHLFNKKLKVIEHTHLMRNSEDTWDVCIKALAYDPNYYRTIGHALKNKLQSTQELRITGGGAELVVTGGVEEPKLNIGDYSEMKNVGGTFPIGEVFTEAKDFAQVNGSVMLYGTAGPDFCINMHEPFRVDIKEGLIKSWSDNTPQTFIDIIAKMKEQERALVRELGFGLNRAITREHYMQDITAFERILGLHLSLGEKHSVYKKQGITADKARFHVDVFPIADEIIADGEVIFKDGQYMV